MKASRPTFGLYQSRNDLGQLLCQIGVALTGQVHEVHLIEFGDALGIQEGEAQSLDHGLVAGSQLPGFGGAAGAHAGVVQFFADVGRTDDQNVGFMLSPAGDAHALFHQPLHAQGDAGSVHAQTVLGVVGAQHDDQQIHGLMAHEDGVGHIQSGHALVKGIGENGGAAGEAFFQNQVFFAQMRLQQERQIKDLEFQIKMAESEYKIMQTEVSDGKVYAAVDGVVVSLITEDEALMTQQPLMKVSGGGGFYVEGTVSELDKDRLVIGQEVTVNDWNTGAVYTGYIEKLGDYPSSGNGWNGIGNPNASYYPFTVFIDETADLQAGRYVDIAYAAGESQHGIYLENPFLRTEGGESYVYLLGADGRLEKRTVVTGKALWGSYTEILSGISETDLIAFPYGKAVKEGAPAEEADISALYE